MTYRFDNVARMAHIKVFFVLSLCMKWKRNRNENVVYVDDDGKIKCFPSEL